MVLGVGRRCSRFPRPSGLRTILGLLVGLVLAVACDGDGASAGGPDVAGPPDDVVAVADGGVVADTDEGLGDAPVSADAAADLGEPLFPNGARALVATADDLIGGPTAAGVPGDVVLRNRHVRFVVRNQERSLLSPYGGALVDADVVREAGAPGQDNFFEVFPMTSFGRVFRAHSMEIVDDGAVSGTAIVRFVGTDGGMTLIDSLLPTTWQGLEVTLEYVLAPEAHHLEIVTTVRNANEGPRAVGVGSVMQLGKRLRRFYDGCGEDQDCLSSHPGTRWLAGATGAVSYGLSPESPATLSLLLAKEELLLLSSGTFPLAAGESVTLRQYLAVGDGRIEDVVQTLLTLRGEPLGTEVPVVVTPGEELSDLRSAFLSARTSGVTKGAWATATWPDADGRGSLHLPPGTWDLELDLPGAVRTILPGVVVGERPPEPVALTANPSGRLHVHVTDSAGAPVTGALVLQPGLDADWHAGRVFFEAIHDGDRTIPVLPGDYTATVSHGLTWTVDRRNVTVLPGAVAELVATIDQAVDTTGGLMMNTHEHCERSIDSQVPVEDRVWNAVANGIDVMNPTDHDFFGSHAGTIARLGLSDRVASFTGCEVSPLWGHTTATGCRTPPAYDTYYAVPFTLYDESGTVLRGATATEIYVSAREVFGCEFLAVNHPYRGGATFETYGITGTSDPEAALPDLDLRLVDAVEVYNKDDDLDVVLNQNLPAWFNLLNRGYAMAAIGGSDEHGYGGNYGNPRNWVPVSQPVSEGVDQTEVFDAVKAFRSQVIGGPVLQIEVDGAGMGDTVAATAGVVTVHLQVLAPPWMGLSFARLYANGEAVRDLVPAADGAVLRLDETFELVLAADAHLVAVAGSLLPEHDMNPVSGKNPLSVTNPVFVDVDGGGYTAVHASGAPWDGAPR